MMSADSISSLRPPMRPHQDVAPELTLRQAKLPVKLLLVNAYTLALRPVATFTRKDETLLRSVPPNVTHCQRQSVGVTKRSVLPPKSICSKNSLTTVIAMLHTEL